MKIVQTFTKETGSGENISGIMQVELNGTNRQMFFKQYDPEKIGSMSFDVLTPADKIEEIKSKMKTEITYSEILRLNKINSPYSYIIEKDGVPTLVSDLVNGKTAVQVGWGSMEEEQKDKLIGQRIRLGNLDAIVGNWDRHYQNWMVAGDDIFGIDNDNAMFSKLTTTFNEGQMYGLTQQSINVMNTRLWSRDLPLELVEVVKSDLMSIDLKQISKEIAKNFNFDESKVSDALNTRVEQYRTYLENHIKFLQSKK